MREPGRVEPGVLGTHAYGGADHSLQLTVELAIDGLRCSRLRASGCAGRAASRLTKFSTLSGRWQPRHLETDACKHRRGDTMARGAARLALAVALVGLAERVGWAAGSTELRQQLTYVSAFEEPRLSYTLNSFMREPGAVLELSHPAYAMELAFDTVELRELLFLQSVALANRAEGSGITMLYAGLADGRFIGYYSPERYTFRATGQSAASSPELVWTPYASADDVPDALGSDSTFIAVSCPGSMRDSEEPGCTPAGCCDSNIRTYHSTSQEARGAPQTLTKWALYDPRLRPWYTEELGRSGSQAGWSSVYVFSGSGNLGITRTAKMARDSALTELHGVLAADFELGGLSRILNDTLARDSKGDGSWAFVAERSGGARGKLVATSFGAALRLDGGERSDVSSLSDEGAAFSESVAAAARYLDARGLLATPPGQALTNTIPGRRGALTPAGGKFEAVATVFALGGLDWLVVVGQDIVCADNEIWDFGTCKACPKGQVPLDDRSCVRCDDIHPGTISDEGIEGGIGTLCVCPPLTYSVRTRQGANECRPCTDLAKRVLGVPLTSTEPIIWDSVRVCPGGVSQVTRICPLPNLWIETQDLVLEGNRDNGVTETDVYLLTCPACASGGCSSRVQNISLPPAVCKPHHRGFMCADCEEGYRVVEGQCVLCDRTDWGGTIVEIFSAIVIGLFLMSKTWSSVCSPADAEEVFKIMDSTRNGYLHVEDVRRLLVRMGNPVAASRTFDETLAQMKAKQYPKLSGLRTRPWFPRWLGAIDQPDRAWVQIDSISRMEFIDWCTDNQNRATVGTYIFALQTFGLVITNSSDLSFLKVFNLDVAKAVKSCRSPQCGVICNLLSMAIVPVCAGMAIYSGMYLMATKAGKQTSTEGTVVSRGLPMRWHHLQRGYMQLYLFTFAPITRRCAEMLSCRRLPKDGSTTDRLGTDLGIICWEGQHVPAAMLAVSVLLFYAVAVPAYLLVRTSRHMRTRLPSQKQTEGQSESQFTEGQNVTPFNRIGLPSFCDPRSFLSSMSEGKEVIGAADAATQLLMESTPTLNPTCWDELIKATKPEKYWWFIFILLLKLLVNLIFLVGQAVEYNWGMWLQIALVSAALLSHFQQPYVLQEDNHQEQLSFLGLVVVLSVTNSGLVYHGGKWMWYHVVVICAVGFAMTFYLVWVEHAHFKRRAAREQRVATGQKNLKQFTRQAFANVVPTFLLLNEQQREAIRAHIQVETFEEGEVIYEEDDPAQAFFIIKEGTVRLQTRDKDRDIRVVSDHGAFGARALAMDLQQRPATAVAVSANVVCLRLIRDDWMRLWPPVTEIVARELFAKLDYDHSGYIELAELEKELMERWHQDPEMSADATSGRHDLDSLVRIASAKLLGILDSNRDGTVTFEEFRVNLRKVPHDDLTAGSAAPPVLQKGDWVRITKEGTHKGEVGVVSDAGWSGRVKVTRQTDQQVCSYLRSEVIKEGGNGLRGHAEVHGERNAAAYRPSLSHTELTGNPLADDRTAPESRTTFEVESVPYGGPMPFMAQQHRMQAGQGASRERQREHLAPPPVAPRPSTAADQHHRRQREAQRARVMQQQRERDRRSAARSPSRGSATLGVPV